MTDTIEHGPDADQAPGGAGYGAPAGIYGPVEDWATDLDHADPAYNPRAPEIWAELRERGCPVAHTDRYNGMWAPITAELVREVTGHEDADFHLLEEREFVRPSHASSLERRREYVFKHALTREVAYSSLPVAGRAALHAAFAARLERDGSANPELAPLIDRLQAQATGAIVALVPAGDDVDQQTVEMYAQLTSGACQALANWWADHAEVPRAVLVDRVMDVVWTGMSKLQA